MAKKRKKRRPPPRPATGPQQETGGARQDRKETARREREQRMRRARRRVLLRRLTRVGILLLVGALIAGIVWFAGASDRRMKNAALAAVEELGCTEIKDQPEQGRDHITGQDPPPDYATKPATSGPHRGDGTLGTDADLDVFPDPVDETLEPLAVHNLEHGYVFMYYRAEGDGALPKPVLDALGDLAREESKVVLAQYPALPNGVSLAYTAWNKLQTCPEVSEADGALAIARGFIAQFRGGGEAPEATAG